VTHPGQRVGSPGVLEAGRGLEVLVVDLAIGSARLGGLQCSQRPGGQQACVRSCECGCRCRCGCGCVESAARVQVLRGTCSLGAAALLPHAPAAGPWSAIGVVPSTAHRVVQQGGDLLHKHRILSVGLGQVGHGRAAAGGELGEGGGQRGTGGPAEPASGTWTASAVWAAAGGHPWGGTGAVTCAPSKQAQHPASCAGNGYAAHHASSATATREGAAGGDREGWG
jgi:hypothetical protein